MKRFVFLLLASTTIGVQVSSAQTLPPKLVTTIFLWPADQQKTSTEHDISKPGERPVDGKPVIRLQDVNKPSITVFLLPLVKIRVQP